MRNKSKLIKWKRQINGKNYDRGYIHIPAAILRNSPIKYGDAVKITADPDNNRLIIEKLASEATSEAKPNTGQRRQQTAKILCPQCQGINILMSKSSDSRKCTFCGFNIKKEDYKYI